jgi:ATP-binding cassette, subfamily B, bacterial
MQESLDMKDHVDTPDEGIKLSDIWKLYGTFGPRLKPYWKWFVLAYAGLLGTVFVNLIKPWPLKLIFDYILLDKPVPEGATYVTSVFGGDKSTLLIVFCVCIVLVVLLDSLFSYSHKYLVAAAGERVINDIRRWVFDHLQILPQSFHGASRSGDLTLRLTSDINAIKKLLIGSVQSFATYALTFVSLTATMLWMDWRLTLVALAVVPPLYIMSFRFSRKVEVLEKTKRAKESEVASIVQETMTSMPVVQAFTQEDQERQRFAKAADESLMADLKKMRLSRTLRRAVQVVIASGTAVVVWYGARRALAGEVTPGDLIVFAAYLKDLYGPIGGFSELVTDFISAAVGSERIAAVMRADSTVKDSPQAVTAPIFAGAVTFEDVTFGYRPGSPVLQNLSFTVEPGQTVALVGSSGTGKSTIVNLLLRFFDPWEGRVLIDGQDLRRFKLDSLRRQMSVVLQESILFRRTIGENIAYGKPHAPFEEIVAAAKAAQTHSFIMKLPHGYDTLVSERGVNLSGGQRQRIALARAILRNAPILILDEPVTGLDAITESQLNATLVRLIEGRTTFVIAHRLSTIQKADLILVIEEGRIVERGTHAELLANSHLYSHLYSLQSEQPVLANGREGDAP